MSDLRSNTPSVSGCSTFVGTIPTNVEHPPRGPDRPTLVAALPADDAPRPQRTERRTPPPFPATTHRDRNAPSATHPPTHPPSSPPFPATTHRHRNAPSAAAVPA